MTNSLDIQKSVLAANGNISLAKELFTMLLDELNLKKEQIKVSFQASDMQQLEEHIHKLYGATAYCVVPDLRDNARKLEHALKNKDYSPVQKLVALVENNIQKTIDDGPGLLEEDWLNYSK